eukprot:m.13401 g.13401  ORF g.13401 m.13401 type:complete len:444 (-) comp5941_c0_seq1:288-1619(-)
MATPSLPATSTGFAHCSLYQYVNVLAMHAECEDSPHSDSGLSDSESLYCLRLYSDEDTLFSMPATSSYDHPLHATDAVVDDIDINVDNVDNDEKEEMGNTSASADVTPWLDNDSVWTNYKARGRKKFENKRRGRNKPKRYHDDWRPQRKTFFEPLAHHITSDHDPSAAHVPSSTYNHAASHANGIVTLDALLPVCTVCQQRRPISTSLRKKISVSTTTPTRQTTISTETPQTQPAAQPKLVCVGCTRDRHAVHNKPKTKKKWQIAAPKIFSAPLVGTPGPMAISVRQCQNMDRKGVAKFVLASISSILPPKASKNALSPFRINAKVVDRFVCAMKCLGFNGTLRTVFHGTPQANMESIRKRGLCVPGTHGVGVANGAVYGHGIYSSSLWSTSHYYCKGRGRILACALLTDVQGTSQPTGTIYVTEREELICPLFSLDPAAFQS